MITLGVGLTGVGSQYHFLEQLLHTAPIITEINTRLIVFFFMVLNLVN